jgi:hypothetical protein
MCQMAAVRARIGQRMPGDVDRTDVLAAALEVESAFQGAPLTDTMTLPKVLPRPCSARS